MKKYLINLITILGIGVVFYACTPEDYVLDEILSETELDFSITQNTEDPNMIILESLTPGATPLWSHPLGRSTRIKDTVRLAFPGLYRFVYGVQSGGGFVQSDTVQLDISTTNLSYVDDPLWNALTGGAGKSKTWILDNGNYGYAPGPMGYADPSVTQEWGDYTPNWEPEDQGQTAEDLSAEMTFSLEGAAMMTTVKPNETTGDETGTYSLNTTTRTLSTTDATIVRLAGYIPNADNWTTDLKILELNENQLRIAIYRTNDEGPWWYIFNYVSKEHAENYVPEDQPDPIPPIDGDGNDVLTTTTTTTKNWVLSPDSPYDWTNLNGDLLNSFESSDEYLSSGWAAYDEDMVNGTQLTFASTSATGGTFTFTSYDQDDVSGDYTVDGNNDIDFGQPLNALISQTDFGWLSSMYLATTAENKLKLIKTKVDLFGTVTDMWLGQRAVDKDEYMVYHFVPNGSGDEGGSSGIEIPFDNSKLVIGDLEGNGNLRLELYNDFGSTKDDPPLDVSQLNFANKISVTFTLSGVTFKGGAAGSYPAAFSYADGDWSMQNWGDGTGEGETSVTGDGTYTVWFAPSSTVEGALVFVIDMVGMSTDLDDPASVSATIDKIEIE